MDRKGNYKIVEVHIGRNSKMHIPYFAYIVAQGPKGGKYLIDLFNIELMAFEQIGRPIRGPMSEELISYGIRTGKAVMHEGDFSTSDENLIKMAKSIGATPLVRKQHRTEFYRLKNSLDIRCIFNTEVVKWR